MKLVEYDRDGKSTGAPVTIDVDVMRSATFLHLVDDDGKRRSFDISRKEWDQFITDALAARARLAEKDSK
jgi:hypothetical protein